jgi:catechol 2,3-dioxygenase-like lactoylglutathione lyase family enzyme
MSVNRLLDITLGVPEPQELADFWTRRGMQLDGACLGTLDRPRQITLVEGPFRQLAALHLGCESSADLAAIATRLGRLGVATEATETTLVCSDPVFGHRVVVDVVGPEPIHAGPARATNGPGAPVRANARADVVVEAAPRPPRRVGHVVLGTPHVDEACAFYLDGLGFRVSDRMLGGIATFARVEADHHNLLIQPSAVSYLNHYALEMDDVDAIGAAGTAVLAERADADVVGIGRHVLGSNIFWYLTDPAGTMFELFADMDQITDDEAWDRDHRRDDWGFDEAGLSTWGPQHPPETFFAPADLAELGAAREAAGLR